MPDTLLLQIALAIIQHPQTGDILIALRPDTAHQGGLWEFPGGKCDPGEAPAACAVREAKEETGLDVTIADTWPALTYTYPDRTVTLYPFVCRTQNADALPLAAREVRWITVQDLETHRFPPANAPLLARLREGDLPPL